MEKRQINNENGFTIIEVLVGAVVFMIGFSILVFMLNQMITRYSINDLTTTTHLGSDIMEYSIATRDTLPCDSTVEVSGIAYRVSKLVSVDNNLAAVDVRIYRSTRNRELCRLYGEFIVPGD